MLEIMESHIFPFTESFLSRWCSFTFCSGSHISHSHISHVRNSSDVVNSQSQDSLCIAYNNMLSSSLITLSLSFCVNPIHVYSMPTVLHNIKEIIASLFSIIYI